MKSMDEFLSSLPALATIVKRKFPDGTRDDVIQAWAWGIEDTEDAMRELIEKWQTADRAGDMSDMAISSRERTAATETFVRDMLRIMGQPADAENVALVRQIARKIMRAMPAWTHPDSPLRRAAERAAEGEG
jgi:hypothetical protein